MKKKRFFEAVRMTAGMLALVLTFGMALVGCDGGSTDDGGGSIVLPATNGLLTVTGLSAYNGKYIMAESGDVVPPYLAGMAGGNRNTGTIELFPISGGQAAIKIYEADDSGNINGYSGSDTVSMRAYISTTRTLVVSGSGELPAAIAEGTVQVTFQNGRANMAFP